MHFIFVSRTGETVIPASDGLIVMVPDDEDLGPLADIGVKPEPITDETNAAEVREKGAVIDERTEQLCMMLAEGVARAKAMLLREALGMGGAIAEPSKDIEGDGWLNYQTIIASPVPEHIWAYGTLVELKDILKDIAM